MAYAQVRPLLPWQGGHVPKEVEAAAEAYRAAKNGVDRAKAAVKTALAVVPVARARLAKAIVADYERGERIGELARRSGYGREQVRRILRKAGIEPD